MRSAQNIGDWIISLSTGNKIAFATLVVTIIAVIITLIQKNRKKKQSSNILDNKIDKNSGNAILGKENKNNIVGGVSIDNINVFLGNVQEDISQLPQKITENLDEICKNAIGKSQKQENENVNMRIFRDVMYNGAFTDENICKEYFGGILASSKSKDGKDDSAIPYLDIIKSLSSSQLRLHYIIYKCASTQLQGNSELNVLMSTDIEKVKLLFDYNEFFNLKINVTEDFQILWKKGLISQFGFGQTTNNYVNLTTLGVTLFTYVHNVKNPRLFLWYSFSQFEKIDLPQICYIDLKKKGAAP